MRFPPRPKPFGSTVAALVFHDPHQCTSDGFQSNRRSADEQREIRGLACADLIDMP
jgi:hypothetical protein